MVQTVAREGIDADEAKLYDRQIRLWGVEAQNRMKNSKVLLVGLRGLHTEVCKNIVLSGINTVYILDSGSVTVESLSACFFLTEDDIGKNVSPLASRTKLIAPLRERKQAPHAFKSSILASRSL